VGLGASPENFEKLDAISGNLAYIFGIRITSDIIQNWAFTEQKTAAATISIHTHTVIIEYTVKGKGSPYSISISITNDSLLYSDTKPPSELRNVYERKQTHIAWKNGYFCEAKKSLASVTICQGPSKNLEHTPFCLA